MSQSFGIEIKLHGGAVALLKCTCVTNFSDNKVHRKEIVMYCAVAADPDKCQLNAKSLRN